MPQERLSRFGGDPPGAPFVLDPSSLRAPASPVSIFSFDLYESLIGRARERECFRVLPPSRLINHWGAKPRSEDWKAILEKPLERFEARGMGD